MKTIEVKTAELEGAALDWAVAIIEGYDVVVHDVGTYRYDKRGGIHCCEYGCTFGTRSITHDVTAYSPSGEWSQGGPLIEKYGIGVAKFFEPIDGPVMVGMEWAAIWIDDSVRMDGHAALVAACRAIVAAKLGDTVQVPADLIGAAA